MLILEEHSFLTQQGPALLCVIRSRNNGYIVSLQYDDGQEDCWVYDSEAKAMLKFSELKERLSANKCLCLTK